MALASPCHGQVIFPLKCVSQLLVTCVLIGSQCDRHCQPGCQTRNMEQQDLLLCRALLMSLGHKIWRYDCIDILDILLRFTYIMDTTWVESKRKLTARATFHELAFYFATFKQHEMFEGCRVLLPCTAPLPIGNVRPHCLFHALHNFSDAHASNIGAQANPSCPEKVVKNSSSSLQASFDWTFTCSYAKIKIVSAVYMMNQYEYIDTWNLYIYIYIYWLRICRIRRYTSCNSKGLLFTVGVQAWLALLPATSFSVDQPFPPQSKLTQTTKSTRTQMRSSNKLRLYVFFFFLFYIHFIWLI